MSGTISEEETKKIKTSFQSDFSNYIKSLLYKDDKSELDPTTFLTLFDKAVVGLIRNNKYQKVGEESIPHKYDCVISGWDWTCKSGTTYYKGFQDDTVAFVSSRNEFQLLNQGNGTFKIKDSNGSFISTGVDKYSFTDIFVISSVDSAIRDSDLDNIYIKIGFDILDLLDLTIHLIIHEVDF
jgi:hypothetical protein